nr:MAG TPA: 50S ribosomal subunit [Caudoviricetes sp.]
MGLKATYRCFDCGEDIYFDEDCWEIDGRVYCKACIEARRLSAPMPEEEEACFR